MFFAWFSLSSVEFETDSLTFLQGMLFNRLSVSIELSKDSSYIIFGAYSRYLLVLVLFIWDFVTIIFKLFSIKGSFENRADSLIEELWEWVVVIFDIPLTFWEVCSFFEREKFLSIELFVLKLWRVVSLLSSLLKLLQRVVNVCWELRILLILFGCF